MMARNILLEVGAIFAGYCILSGLASTTTQSPLYITTKNARDQCVADLQTCTGNACQNGGTYNSATGECDCPPPYGGVHCQKLPKDCTEATAFGCTGDRNVLIQPDNSPPITVRCVCAWGGWTIIARRGSEYRGNTPMVTFDRSWNGYKGFFGDVNREHFIGLENMYNLLAQGDYRASVGIQYAQAYYDHISIDNEANKYSLHYVSYTPFSNPLQDGFGMNNMNWNRFCTFDDDCDNCGADTNSGWWFGTSCTKANLFVPEDSYGVFGEWPTSVANQCFNITISSYIMVKRNVPDIGTPFEDNLLPVFKDVTDDIDALEAEIGGLPETTLDSMVTLLSAFNNDSSRLQFVSNDAAEALSNSSVLVTILDGTVVSGFNVFADLLKLFGNILMDLANILCKIANVLMYIGEWMKEFPFGFLDRIGSQLIRLGHALLALCEKLKEFARLLCELAGGNANPPWTLLRRLCELMESIGECICRYGRLLAQLGRILRDLGLEIFGKFIERIGIIIDKISWIMTRLSKLLKRMTRRLFRRFKNSIINMCRRFGELLKKIGQLIQHYLSPLLDWSLSSLLGGFVKGCLQLVLNLAKIMVKIGEILIKLSELFRLLDSLPPLFGG